MKTDRSSFHCVQLSDLGSRAALGPFGRQYSRAASSAMAGRIILVLAILTTKATCLGIQAYHGLSSESYHLLDRIQLDKV